MRLHSAAIGVGLVLISGLIGCFPGSTAAPVIVPRPLLTQDFVERIDGSTATIPLTTAAVRLLRGTDIGLQHNKTIEAYERLIRSKKDIIFVTAPSEEELAMAKTAGVDLEFIPIVNDALVFLVNTANPVDGLTQQQVKEIYSGQITNWEQVDGDNQRIMAYQRQINSGSQTLFLQLAMQETIPMDVPYTQRPDDMDSLIDAISMYDNSELAIGYSVYYYTQQMYVNDQVKLLAIDGATPTNQSIADEEYPYLTHYYAVIRASEPKDSLARQLIAWFLTDEAQQLASGTGYIPLDSANVTPLRTDYGYFGSTPQNTTQSSGTGGPVGVRSKQLSDPVSCLSYCEFNDGKVIMTDSEYPEQPQYPEAEAAIQAWHDSLPQAISADDDHQQPLRLFGMVSQDLIHFWRSIWISDESGALTTRIDTASFRLTDGHRMLLSDFFYNGVNYISFINQNLLNFETNQVLAESDPPYYSPQLNLEDAIVPFTGIPSDFDQFQFGWTKSECIGTPTAPKGTAALTFTFPADNPFFQCVTDDLTLIEFQVSLNLPADLSPYGTYWRLDRTKIGVPWVDHLVRDYAGINLTDQVINSKIDELARKYAGASSVKITGFTDVELEVEVFAADRTRDMRTDGIADGIHRFSLIDGGAVYWRERDSGSCDTIYSVYGQAPNKKQYDLSEALIDLEYSRSPNKADEYELSLWYQNCYFWETPVLVSGDLWSPDTHRRIDYTSECPGKTNPPRWIRDLLDNPFQVKIKMGNNQIRLSSKEAFIDFSLLC